MCEYTQWVLWRNCMFDNEEIWRREVLSGSIDEQKRCHLIEKRFTCRNSIPIKSDVNKEENIILRDSLGFLKGNTEKEAAKKSNEEIGAPKNYMEDSEVNDNEEASRINTENGMTNNELGYPGTSEGSNVGEASKIHDNDKINKNLKGSLKTPEADNDAKNRKLNNALKDVAMSPSNSDDTDQLRSKAHDLPAKNANNDSTKKLRGSKNIVTIASLSALGAVALVGSISGFTYYFKKKPVVSEGAEIQISEGLTSTSDNPLFFNYLNSVDNTTF
ncbi:hypothetical protein Zmor_024828 [Zophobas morio]|uniref:Uncharacterized protein n=1 Tax=Zophobas morio TaxID=2755281 RepID=A0AA38HKL8_9CUCU|nr:hypothetical protein Zmor_024828 [Zophobas morio]